MKRQWSKQTKRGISGYTKAIVYIGIVTMLGNIVMVPVAEAKEHTQVVGIQENENQTVVGENYLVIEENQTDASETTPGTGENQTDASETTPGTGENQTDANETTPETGENQTDANETTPESGEDQNNPDVKEPVYKNVKETVYVTKNCTVYEEPDTNSNKLGTAIPYKKYTRIGLGEEGFDQITFEGETGYIKSTELTTKKPSIPTDVVSTTDKLYDYSNMKADLKLLSRYYPDILSVTTIGTTSDKRNLYCAILGNPNAEKHILIQGSIHAREYINTQLLMAQLEYFLVHYEKGSYEGTTYKELFDEVAIHIIPMANPDGVIISQYGLKKIRDKKLVIALQGMQKSSNYTRWKANAKGVDLNKNFSFGWTKKTGVKKPGSMNYPGTKALSQKESKAMVAYTESISGLKTVLSYHCMGNIIYWNYGQKGTLMKKCKELVNLVKKLTGYSLVTQSYKTISYGGFSDWAVRDLGVPAITIETGMISAPVSHSQYKTIWKQTKDIIPAVAAQVLGK
ncbi:M14 family metallopeptidase [Anaerosporobacter faecicola]|uniref:M14 family metallopeptidase n=1 Tax=Anaerosporobacter faecicola TaxID=2718714 RepID=UPI00143A6CE6|nr:M14 family zinc carboxypeptidase [Anaerosporobacter faecicola]